jgi:hypothetical protein
MKRLPESPERMQKPRAHGAIDNDKITSLGVPSGRPRNDVHDHLVLRMGFREMGRNGAVPDEIQKSSACRCTAGPAEDATRRSAVDGKHGRGKCPCAASP